MSPILFLPGSAWARPGFQPVLIQGGKLPAPPVVVPAVVAPAGASPESRIA